MTEPWEQDPQEKARDAFIPPALDALIKPCVRAGKHNPLWCVTHEAYWPQNVYACNTYVDRDDFADSIIEMWQGQEGTS